MSYRKEYFVVWCSDVRKWLAVRAYPDGVGAVMDSGTRSEMLDLAAIARG